MLSLEKYFKKYIWDDERTPYFVPVPRMTRRQADYELHAYAVFVGILFAMVTGGALLSQDPHIKSEAVAIYAFTMVCATIILGFTKAVYPAWYCAIAPLVALLGAAQGGTVLLAEAAGHERLARILLVL